jgi:hypothetical protein
MDSQLFYLKSKDFSLATGTGERNGAYVRTKVLKYFGKEDHACITVIEYSVYSHLPLRQIFFLLKKKISEEDLKELEHQKELFIIEWEAKKARKKNNGNGDVQD